MALAGEVQVQEVCRCRRQVWRLIDKFVGEGDRLGGSGDKFVGARDRFGV